MSMGAVDTERTVEPEEEWEARISGLLASGLLQTQLPVQTMSQLNSRLADQKVELRERQQKDFMFVSPRVSWLSPIDHMRLVTWKEDAAKLLLAKKKLAASQIQGT